MSAHQWLWLATCLLGLIPSFSTAQEFYVMPKKLVEDAKTHGCEQISNFYNRYGVFRPPYVFDEKDASPEPGFAYWCRRPLSGGDANFDHVLVVNATRGFDSFSGCPSEIKSKNYPNGLSIEVEEGLSLSSFVYIDNPKRRGPSVPTTQKMIISGDETSEAFYCYKGKWLVYVRH